MSHTKSFIKQNGINKYESICGLLTMRAVKKQNRINNDEKREAAVKNKIKMKKILNGIKFPLI